MTARRFICFLLIILSFLACSQQAKKDRQKFVVQDVQLEDVEEDIEPPPHHVTSTFRSLPDWLLNIGNKDKPKKFIAKYKLGLFESSMDYILVLVGVNTHKEGKYRSVTQVDFKPANMYFKLPKAYYEKLDREQLLNKITSQLKDFTNTQSFKTSFFSKANTIVFETNGQTVWSNGNEQPLPGVVHEPKLLDTGK